MKEKTCKLFITNFPVELRLALKIAALKQDKHMQDLIIAVLTEYIEGREEK